MKKETISEAIGAISAQHIQEAAAYAAPKALARPSISILKKTAVAAAILACAVATSAHSPAIAESIKGFFRDIVRWDGTVTGTEYKNATNELEIHALEAVLENGTLLLPVEITLHNTNKAPFRYLHTVTLGDYKIVNASGNEIPPTGTPEEKPGVFENGKAMITLPISSKKLPAGAYTLIVESIFESHKAEQPLKIEGHWETSWRVP